MTNASSPPPVHTRTSLGIGGVLNDTLRFVFENFAKVSVIALLPLAPVILVVGILILLGFDPVSFADLMMDPGGLGSGSVVQSIIATFVLVGLLVLSFYAFFVVAITKAVFDHRYGAGVHVKAATALGLNRFFAALGVLIVSVIAVVAAMIPVVLFSAVVPFLGVILAVVAMLVLSTFLSCAVPIVAFERVGTGAISRSIALVKPYFWPGLGALVVISLINELFGAAVVALIHGVGVPVFVATVLELGLSLLQIMVYASFAATLYCRLNDLQYGPPTTGDADIFA